MQRVLALVLVAFALLLGFGVAGVMRSKIEAQPTPPRTTPQATEAAVEPASTPESDSSIKYFSTPDGKVGCVVVLSEEEDGLDNFARCDVPDRQWQAPKPANCPDEYDFGQGVVLEPMGAAEVACATDTAFGEYKVLEEGEYVSNGAITCHTTPEAAICISKKDGYHGFYVSAKTYDVF